MKKIEISLPTLREMVVSVTISVIFLILTAIFVGYRPEHSILIGLVLVMFFFNQNTRKLVVGLLPFLLFGISYDWMRVYPNYMVNPIDVQDLYNLEKSLFGISSGGHTLIPSEYFAIHHIPFLDFLSGVFYLGWVPIPLAFGVYLYVRKHRNNFLRFGMVFLFVNLLGFLGYYIHPAAPPWYAMKYGFQAVINTPGNMAGLARFDQLVGLPIFNSIYGRNANVFAAVPSLHSAYLVVVLFYAFRDKVSWILKGFIILFMFGIWFTAVYAGHHYIVDVTLGILCALLGIFLFEKGLMNLPGFRNFYDKYLRYIS